MSLPQLETKRYPIDILTEHYLLQCVVEPVGMLMTYFDSPDRTNFLVKDINMSGLGMDSAVSTVKIKELWVQREEIVVIRVNEEYLQGTLQKLPTIEKLRVFLPRFVVQGTFNHGEDTRLGDMFDVLKGTWVAAHNVQMFPLTALKTQVFRDVPLLLINKNYIHFYESLPA